MLSTSFRNVLLGTLHRRSKFANFCHDLMQNHLSLLPMHKKFYSNHWFSNKSNIFTFSHIVKMNANYAERLLSILKLLIRSGQSKKNILILNETPNKKRCSEICRKDSSGFEPNFLLIMYEHNQEIKTNNKNTQHTQPHTHTQSINTVPKYRMMFYILSAST